MLAIVVSKKSDVLFALLSSASAKNDGAIKRPNDKIQCASRIPGFDKIFINLLLLLISDDEDHLTTCMEE